MSNSDYGAGPPIPDGPLDSGGYSAPFGPSELPVKTHGGIFDPPFGRREAARSETNWLSLVDEAQLLCPTCRWAWRIERHAPVANARPDGTPFVEREGYCLLPARLPGGAPLPLEDRFVLRCNQYAPQGVWRRLLALSGRVR